METITETSLQRTNAIKRLTSIANHDDRFKLFNDATVPAGDLDNPIHPIFHHEHFLGRTPHIKQALQLASLYLTIPSLLKFYVPLTFGVKHKEQVGTTNIKHHIYIQEKSRNREKELMIVQAAFNCLAHCHTWEWFDFSNGQIKNCWGTTFIKQELTVRHTDHCPVFDKTGKPLFKPCGKTCTKVDEQMLAYYQDEESGYKSRPRCEQFRHDFQMALVLGHEIAHAYGAMLRGNLKEPYLHPSHPEPELGYAWENFMFGGKLNPPDKTKHGSYAHLHMVWQSKQVSKQNWGFEYSAVPVAWTAQWFRKETWAKVKKEGHLAILPPDPILKIYYSTEMQRHIVYTDDEDARDELGWGRDSAALEYLFSTGGPYGTKCSRDLSRSFCMPMTGLAKSSFTRTPKRHRSDVSEDHQQYLIKAKHRDFEALRAMNITKNRLKRSRILSVAPGVKSSEFKPMRFLKKLPVTGDLMASNKGYSSSTIPTGWKTSEDSADFLSAKYIGYKPEFYSTQPLSNKGLHGASSVHHLGKRSREHSHSGSSLPWKKPRRDH